MWNWLKGRMASLVDAQAKAQSFQQFILGLIQSKPEAAVVALHQQVCSLSEADYLIFQQTVAALAQQAEQGVTQLEQLESHGWGDSFEGRIASTLAGVPDSPQLAQARYVLNSLREAGVTPVRGDVAEGDEIIQSIWEETTSATHVFVDLTGYNLNVCLELGVADTLGRPTFLFGCEGTEKTPFRCIEKRRIHIYGEKLLESPAFAPALDRFIKANFKSLGGQ